MAVGATERRWRGLTVGSGHFAPIQLEAWRAVRDASIVGLVSQDEPARVAGVANAAGIDHHGVDFDDAIAALRPDFVDICTPPGSHGAYVRRAADCGLPILCQKPIAPTLEESAELVDYCAERGVPLLVNENWRWQPWYREIHSLLTDGRIGAAFHARIVMRPGDGWGMYPYPEQPYFKTMERFLLVETAIHYFDTVDFLFGPIRDVWCRTGTINPVVRGEDLVVAVLGLESGASVLYDANRVACTATVRSSAYGTMVVEGPLGTIRLDDDGTIWLQDRDGLERRHAYRMPPGWKGGAAVAAQQHFVDCLNGEAIPETSGASYLRAMAVVEACYRSARDERKVSVAELLALVGVERPIQR